VGSLGQEGAPRGIYLGGRGGGTPEGRGDVLTESSRESSVFLRDRPASSGHREEGSRWGERGGGRLASLKTGEDLPFGILMEQAISGRFLEGKIQTG